MPMSRLYRSFVQAGATLLLTGVTLGSSAADHIQGQRLFRAQCIGCHSLEPGRHLAGPSLHELIGRPAGSIEDFNYSAALERADLVWNRETLNAFLAGPDSFLPGTYMVLWGLDESSRQPIIDYLESLAAPAAQASN